MMCQKNSTYAEFVETSVDSLTLGQQNLGIWPTSARSYKARPGQGSLISEECLTPDEKEKMRASRAATGSNPCAQPPRSETAVFFNIFFDLSCNQLHLQALLLLLVILLRPIPATMIQPMDRAGISFVHSSIVEVQDAAQQQAVHRKQTCSFGASARTLPTIKTSCPRSNRHHLSTCKGVGVPW